MEGQIRTVNYRTGDHWHNVGDIWETLDGCHGSFGYQTVIAARSGTDGSIKLLESRYISKPLAKQIADFMKRFEGTLEEAREILLNNPEWRIALTSKPLEVTK